jgi:hypothetical protein
VLSPITKKGEIVRKMDMTHLTKSCELMCFASVYVFSSQYATWFWTKALRELNLKEDIGGWIKDLPTSRKSKTQDKRSLKKKRKR